MILPTFPESLQKHQGISWGFMGGTQDGGTSLAGGPPTSYSLLGGPYWAVDMSSLVINELRRAHYHMWEAILDQGIQPFILPCREFDLDQPWLTDEDRQLSRSGSVPFSDGSLFGDGVGFSGQYIAILPQTDLVLRQTIFSVKVARGKALVGGEHFTIAHPTWGPRMYRIRYAYALDSSNVQQIEIRPPLREVSPLASTLLDFDNPRSVMKLNMKDGMRAKFDITRNARPDLSFVEYGSKIPTS